MSVIPSSELIIRQAMAAPTPELRFEEIWNAYRQHHAGDPDAFVAVLAAHLTLVPVPQTVAA